MTKLQNTKDSEIILQVIHLHWPSGTTSFQVYSAREMGWLTQDCSRSWSRVILFSGIGCSRSDNMSCSSGREETDNGEEKNILTK